MRGAVRAVTRAACRPYGAPRPASASVPHPSALSPVLAYVVKVWMAGLAATVLVPLALGTALLDTVLRTPPPDRLSTRVLGWSAQLEVALDAHGALTDLRMTPEGVRARG